VSLDDANATYLIVGGVTGIGSSVTEWMVSKGAKNLLLVSRHATIHPNGPKLQAQGEAAGCNMHIRDCDISDEKSLVELLAESARTLPPIRGVINGAMVLDVSLALPVPLSTST
jgi:NAD(P)-dependent dehydrogenase (short-subunit alcohol dehydrogenase family)